MEEPFGQAHGRLGATTEEQRDRARRDEDRAGGARGGASRGRRRGRGRARLVGVGGRSAGEDEDGQVSLLLERMRLGTHGG